MDEDEEVFGAWDDEAAAQKQAAKEERHRKVMANQQLLRASITFYPKDAAPFGKKRTAAELGPRARAQPSKRQPRRTVLGPEEEEALERRVEALRSARSLYKTAVAGADAATVEYFAQQLAESDKTFRESRKALRRNHINKGKES